MPMLLFFLISLVIRNGEAQTADFLMSSCSSKTGNYTPNSPYRANLETLLSSLASHTHITYGFFNFSSGDHPHRVYAIAHCRADLQPQECRACVNTSTTKLLAVCPYQKEAFGWFERCMVRYSNSSIYGIYEQRPRLGLVNTDIVENKTLFNEKLTALLDGMRDRAASGDSQRKDAMSNITLSPSLPVYGLSQCTPDLSRSQCISCLDWLVSFMRSCCDGMQGGRFCTPSCYLRYELDDLFFGPQSIPPPPPPPPSPPGLSAESPSLPASGNRSKASRKAIIVGVPTAIGGIVVIGVCICIFLRSRSRSKEIVGIPEDITRLDSLQFDIGTIKEATDSFSDANKLGQGGFEAFYKGRLPDGQEIAVKRLVKDSRQGDLEFKNEVVLVVNLQHRNLVRLLGFCLEKTERFLVYEFLQNSSLDHYIFDETKSQHLDWGRRYKIIGGIARGLLYLHEDSRVRIIHRDLKASNILLDAEMNAKISDFGMARFFGMDQTKGDTSRIVGSCGYMAPEYAMQGRFSVKTDVFSFGVLVLEIMAGQQNNFVGNGESAENLVRWAWRNWREGRGVNVVDARVREGGSTSEMMRCIHIGLLCVQESEDDRPNMASVVLMLDSHSLTLAVPLQPAFFMHTTIDQSVEASSLFDNKSVTESSVEEAPTPHLYPR